MKVINFNEAAKKKAQVMESEVITLEKVKQFSNSDLLDHLQEAIDWLNEDEHYSDKWQFSRNWIDDIVAILDERLK